MLTCTKTLSARAGDLTLGLALVLAPTDGAAAQETHTHEDGTVHIHDGLHFTHPMIAESVTPDRKLRLDYQYFEFPDGDTESSSVLEGEWAFRRSFSIEAGIPYSYTASEFGNLEVLFKFANYAFEDAGLLLGYGLELGVPTNGEPDEEAAAADAALLASRVRLPRAAARFS
ncbi:MAG: hypothetical protein R3266_14500, partial [Gemmatimonadota bacterium]|nr:hypothetical protein [Gemmatimonadota bacterium]